MLKSDKAFSDRQFPSGSNSFWIILGVVSWGALIVSLVRQFFPYNSIVFTDEAEHLRVILGFEKGLFPYRDYLENHPIFPHILAFGLSKALGLESVVGLYYLMKFIILMHFLGCVGLVIWFFSKFRDTLAVVGVVPVIVVAALMSLNIWSSEQEWLWGMQSIWQIRPDWPATFYLLASVILHFVHTRAMALNENPGRRGALPLFGGICLGISIAILPKFVFFFLPYLLTLSIVLAHDFSHLKSLVRYRLREVVKSNLQFLVLAVIVAGSCAFFEIWYLDASWRLYFSYVFEINMLKHPLSLGMTSDWNPWNLLRTMSTLSLATFSIAVILFFTRFLSIARQSPVKLEFGVLLFGGLLLVSNMALPAFTNAMVFPWYFIPSLFGFTILLTLLISRILALRNLWFFWLLGVALIFQIGRTTWMGIAGVSSSPLYRCLQARDSSQNCFLSVLDDSRELPTDLTYLANRFETIPLKASIWNYYFLSSISEKFWKNAYDLGLGPHPLDDFTFKATSRPPDVILAESPDSFEIMLIVWKLAQGYSFFGPARKMFRDYRCYLRGSDKIFIRPIHEGRFVSLGWKTCG